MATKGLQGFSRSLNALRKGLSIPNSKDPLTQCLAPILTRSMATEASLPPLSTPDPSLPSPPQQFSPLSSVLTTIHAFPSLEPLRFHPYPATHLHLPLRRDILHRALNYEGDAHRAGTGSTKTRWEIHGSHRKIRPQKGTGRARLGSRQAPHLKGGAKAHGPKPRDFSSGLPRKMYDLAWRTALSLRWRRGELVVCEKLDVPVDKGRWVRNVFAHQGWGRAGGRSLLVSTHERKNLGAALEGMPEEGRILTLEEVDVKDLLEMGRVVIEKAALDELLKRHESDLTGRTWVEGV